MKIKVGNRIQLNKDVHVLYIFDNPAAFLKKPN